MPEDIVNTLVDELEKEAVPYAAFTVAKGETLKGTGAVRSKAKTGGLEGLAIIDEFEILAKTFYEAAGRKGGDAKHYASNLRRALGDNYQPLLEAIGIGDVDEVTKLMKDAHVGDVGTSKLESIIARLQKLKPDEAISAGKKMIAKLGGTAADYVKAITSPGDIYRVLSQQRRLAYNFK